MMGTIAAATASGRLLGLSAEQLYHCVSLGVLNASGITVVQYGGLAKRWYAGRAAEIGVQSALLAERGFTAPPDALGHEFGGFLTTFAPGRDHDVEALTRGLGERFAAGGISFKLHACCGMNQAAIDMLGELVRGSGFSGAEVDRIDIRMTEHGYKHSGFPYVPGSAVTAQFSVEYCLAAYLLEGAVFVDQFREALLADPRILALVDRMTTTSDPSLQTADPRSKRAAALRVTLRDGRVLERQGMTARGHADLPASEEQLRDKFDRLVADVLSPERADALSRATQGLESMDDVAQLVRVVVEPRGGR
jgi:2-methylcitrate dehydratase PrpD